MTEKLGMIPLAGCRIVLQSSLKANCFSISHPHRRTYFLSADSDHQMEEWIREILAVIGEIGDEDTLKSLQTIDLPGKCCGLCGGERGENREDMAKIRKKKYFFSFNPFPSLPSGFDDLLLAKTDDFPEIKELVQKNKGPIKCIRMAVVRAEDLCLSKELLKKHLYCKVFFFFSFFLFSFFFFSFLFSLFPSFPLSSPQPLLLLSRLK